MVKACGGAVWNYLRFDADTPGDTTVQIRVRVADTEEGLNTATWYGPFTTSPVDLQESPPGPVPNGQYMDIEVTLLNFGDIAYPTLHSLEVSYECPIS